MYVLAARRGVRGKGSEATLHGPPPFDFIFPSLSHTQRGANYQRLIFLFSFSNLKSCKEITSEQCSSMILDTRGCEKNISITTVKKKKIKDFDQFK